MKKEIKTNCDKENIKPLEMEKELGTKKKESSVKVGTQEFKEVWRNPKFKKEKEITTNCDRNKIFPLKEFNLSEKMRKGNEEDFVDCSVLNVKDIKEFIRLLKDLFDKSRMDERYDKLFSEIDKLAGSDLI